MQTGTVSTYVGPGVGLHQNEMDSAMVELASWLGIGQLKMARTLATYGWPVEKLSQALASCCIYMI